MKTSGTFRRYLGLWTSGLAAGALAACASPTAPTPSSAGAPVAVPLKSSADRGAPARLWRGGGIAAAPAATPAASAVTLIGRLAPAWGAPAGTADLIPLATVAVDGGDVVRVRQQIDGIAVDGGELRVLVGRGGTLIAAAGALVPADIARDRSSYRLDAAAAVARAIGDLHGVDIADTALRGHHKAGAATGGDDVAWFAGEVAGVHVEEARARKLWHRDGDALVAAWVVEAFTSSVDTTDALAYRTVVGARDGRVLARRDLTHDAFQYRVFAENGGDKRPLDGPVADFSPHPTGEPGGARPSFIPPNLVSVDGLNHPADGAAADPWLAADATETVGNNVDAYTDINSPSGLSQGDFRAEVTGAGVFDRTYDPTVGPLTSGEQQRAAITQLFYSINWLHDDWYDAGFTEAAGNGQQDNYGRGGVAGDRIRAEAQDGANNGNRNNANMSTPDDGMSPRMQVYLWSGLEDRLLTVQSSNRTPASRGAAFGPQSYDVQGDLVAAVDGGGTSPSDGCEPLTNAAAVAGKIALVDRGVCTFKTKTLNAQNAGAIGVILANNAASTSPPSMPNDAMITTPITIPTMSVLQSEGATLRTELMAGPVQMAMHRAVGPEADGALDGALVAHEFGHYVHHRLSLCGTAQCGAMSEGWGDFIALHMIARPGDDLTGTYSVSGYAYAGDPYFGIRRAPYSITTSKNAFTFRHVADGQALPSTHPISGGGPNSEVHNAGEVWAEAMWEAYVALQQARGAASFDEVRRKMQRYVVAGLLMSPPDATFTEVRDAILAAAQASSPADHGTLANAFARRGLGSCAVSPARDSDDFVGVVESFDVKGHASAGAPQLAVDVKDCDDDDNLDVGETATLTVPVVNTGAAALSDVVVSVATTTPGVTIVTPSVTVGSLAPYASGMATFQVPPRRRHRAGRRHPRRHRGVAGRLHRDPADPAAGPPRGRRSRGPVGVRHLRRRRLAVDAERRQRGGGVEARRDHRARSPLARHRPRHRHRRQPGVAADDRQQRRGPHQLRPQLPVRVLAGHVLRRRRHRDHHRRGCDLGRRRDAHLGAVRRRARRPVGQPARRPDGVRRHQPVVPGHRSRHPRFRHPAGRQDLPAALPHRHRRRRRLARLGPRRPGGDRPGQHAVPGAGRRRRHV